MTRAVVAVVLAGLASSGCATMLRRQERGSAGANISVVVQHPDPVILLDGQERTKQLIYDGARHRSSYYVYRVFPAGRPDRVEVTVKDASGALIGAGSTRRHSEGLGWFMVSGLFVLIDWPLGALSYYDDVRIVTVSPPSSPAPPPPPAPAAPSPAAAPAPAVSARPPR